MRPMPSTRLTCSRIGATFTTLTNGSTSRQPTTNRREAIKHHSGNRGLLRMDQLRIDTTPALSPMKPKAHLRLRFVGNRPRILVAEPYYTSVSIVQTAAGALGGFASIIGGIAAIVDNGVAPLLGLAVVCLVVFIGGELTLVRAASLRGRLPVSGSDSSPVVCRTGHHAYQPQGITTEDRLGITPRPQPPRMVWTLISGLDEDLDTT